MGNYVSRELYSSSRASSSWPNCLSASDFRTREVIFYDTGVDYTVATYLNSVRNLRPFTDNSNPHIRHIGFPAVNLEIIATADVTASFDYYLFVQD